MEKFNLKQVAEILEIPRDRLYYKYNKRKLKLDSNNMISKEDLIYCMKNWVKKPKKFKLPFNVD